MVVLCDRDHARTVLRDPAVFAAGAAREAMAELQGPRSIFLRDDADHVAERKLLLPQFHGENLDRYCLEMREAAARSLSSWPQGRDFSLLPLLQDMTLDLILRVIFGQSPDGAAGRLGPALTALAGYISHPLGLLATDLPHRLGPINFWRRYERVKAAVDSLLREEVSLRRSRDGADQGGDIASALVAARRGNGSSLSDDELRDELITLILAAYDTTATALAWTFLHILRDESVLARLRAECRGGEVNGPYLDAVVKEALRLNPPVPIVDRKVTEERNVGGWALPAGTIVALCTALMQRDSRYYDQPLQFIPERFLGVQPDTYTWLPFGGGVRRCLGASFAQLQMKVVVAAAVSRFEMARSRRRREASRRRLIVLAPSQGARIRVIIRRPVDPLHPGQSAGAEAAPGGETPRIVCT